MKKIKKIAIGILKQDGTPLTCEDIPEGYTIETELINGSFYVKNIREQNRSEIENEALYFAITIIMNILDEHDYDFPEAKKYTDTIREMIDSELDLMINDG